MVFSLFYLVWNKISARRTIYLDCVNYNLAITGNVRMMELYYRLTGRLNNKKTVININANNADKIVDELEKLDKLLNNK